MQVAIKEKAEATEKEDKKEGEESEEKKDDIALDGPEIDANEGWTKEEDEEAKRVRLAFAPISDNYIYIYIYKTCLCTHQ